MIVIQLIQKLMHKTELFFAGFRFYLWTSSER